MGSVPEDEDLVDYDEEEEAAEPLPPSSFPVAGGAEAPAGFGQGSAGASTSAQPKPAGASAVPGVGATDQASLGLDLASFANADPDLRRLAAALIEQSKSQSERYSKLENEVKTLRARNAVLEAGLGLNEESSEHCPRDKRSETRYFKPGRDRIPTPNVPRLLTHTGEPLFDAVSGLKPEEKNKKLSPKGYEVATLGSALLYLADLASYFSTVIAPELAKVAGGAQEVKKVENTISGILSILDDRRSFLYVSTFYSHNPALVSSIEKTVYTEFLHGTVPEGGVVHEALHSFLSLEESAIITRAAKLAAEAALAKPGKKREGEGSSGKKSGKDSKSRKGSDAKAADKQ